MALTRESNIRVLAEVGFETNDIPLRPHLEVHHIQTALSLVESGLGVAILPAYSLAAQRGREVVARPLIDPPIVREVRLTTARDRAPSTATTAVRTMLRRVLREVWPVK